jgi:cytosine/adenosine deaminase-related metal-dependent hydrolase
MILSADWVLPVSGRPIRDGAVWSRSSRIDTVGHIDDVVAAAGVRESVQHFPGCVIMPGLVNAHTHLSLTGLAGLLPTSSQRTWHAALSAAVRALDDDDFSACAISGAVQCLRSGVTAVGDIANGPESLAACADTGLGGVFYWEVAGLEAEELSGELANREFPTDSGRTPAARSRWGISPQTPYTSGPALLQAAHRVASTHMLGFALHVAESPAERELMISGTGTLAGVARRLAQGFDAPRTGTVEYLLRLGVLDGAVAVHCTNIEEGDATRLKRHARGVVLCPRSDARLGNGPPPVAALSRSGVRMAVGTESLASTPDLDLFAEARALRELDVTLTPARTIDILTREGSAVLGVEDAFGTLEHGKQADFVMLETGPTSDPEDAVVAKGGPDTVVAVVSGGLWRVRDHKLVFPTDATDRACARAGRRAADALVDARPS